MIDVIKSSHMAFNGPIASGLRAVCILCECGNIGVDIDTLVALDYLVVNSADEGGPVSLHPPVPQRTGELAVRRPLLEEGLNLMELKGLIERSYENRGIVFKASPLASGAVDALEKDYTRALRLRAEWAIDFALKDGELSRDVLGDAVQRWDRHLSLASEV